MTRILVAIEAMAIEMVDFPIKKDDFLVCGWETLGSS